VRLTHLAMVADAVDVMGEARIRPRGSMAIWNA